MGDSDAFDQYYTFEMAFWNHLPKFDTEAIHHQNKQ